MLVNKSIPSLFNGVSQQPATLRSDTQGELSENCYPSIATGLRKRPPTTYLAKLLSSPLGSATVHVINRDVSERYVVFVSNGDLKVFSLIDGTMKTVSFPVGASYLNSSDPSSDFRLVTVADYTFVLNKAVTVQATGSSPARPANVAYFNMVSYQTDIAYTITINGVSASVLTDSSPHDTTWLAGQMQSALQAALGTDYAVATITDTAVIKVTCNTGSITSAGIHDGFGNTASTDLYHDVQRFSQLPSKFDPGYTIKITGDPSSGNSTYYVEFKNGSWVETTAPAIVNGLDAATLPHKLVREADGTFTFARLDWLPRLVGDEETCPSPTFVGRNIADIFYYRGRLGFLSGESVCLSRTGQYFNFWPKSATAVLDTDPIDTNVGTNKVSILKYAVPFDKSLLLFSDQTQFQLTGGQEMLSPKTVKADVATEFDSGTAARPVGIGQAVYFGVTAGQRTGVREYYVDATTLTNEAVDITAHVPTYIPANLFKLASSSSSDVLFALCRDEPSAVYVYKFFWEGNTKAQSAWGKFILEGTSAVLGAEFINNKCYLVVNRSDGCYLEYMDLQPDLIEGPLPFQVMLDQKVLVRGAYDAGTGLTTWTLPYAISGSLDNYVGVLCNDYVKRSGVVLKLSQGPTTDTITAVGDFAPGGSNGYGGVYFGRKYTQRYRFSTQYVKDQNKVAMTNGKLKLRRFRLDYSSSGYFRVEVQPQARDTYTYSFTGKTLGSLSATIGQPSIQSGTFSFPVMTSNIGVRIEIVNDSHLPATFQSAGWDGEFVSFGRRV